MQSRLRLIFAGTPQFAADHLQALLDAASPSQDESPYDIVAVYTQPDRPAGRGKKLTPSPVKVLAESKCLHILQPASLKSDEAQAELAALQADLMIVVAYGLILPQKVLDTPRLGCINVHGSLLPRWRGAAPIQRAIEAGDSETGITIMQMDAGLDTGDMLAMTTCPITQTDTTISVFEKLTKIGTETLNAVVDSLAKDPSNLTPRPQDDKLATYANKITKQEAMIDWSESADLINRKIRAFNPFPVAYTQLGGDRIKIYQASVLTDASQNNQTVEQAGRIIAIEDEGISITCGPHQGSDAARPTILRIETIQLPGKKAMSTKAILLGHKDRFSIGDQFELPHRETH